MHKKSIELNGERGFAAMVEVDNPVIGFLAEYIGPAKKADGETHRILRPIKREVKFNVVVKRIRELMQSGLYIDEIANVISEHFGIEDKALRIRGPRPIKKSEISQFKELSEDFSMTVDI